MSLSKILPNSAQMLNIFRYLKVSQKNLGFLRTGKKSTRTGTGPSLTIAYMSIIRCKEYTV